jgi:ATP-dependent Clp protease adaptor protein ClpS
LQQNKNMRYINSYDFDELEDVLVAEDDTDTGNNSYLIVFNDDHNSFDWVIETFVEILNHENEQAEQLAIIIHSKGKATVKTAPLSKLRPLREGLVDRGLSAVIEQN